MNTIYKYGPVKPYYDTIVQGRIVHVGMQNDDYTIEACLQFSIYVWAEQGENLPPSKVKYVGTGQPYDGVYVGTVFEAEADGMLVWHVIKEIV